MKSNLILITLALLLSISTGCKKDLIVGCTNPDAENYDPDAEEDSGFCLVRGYTDPTADNFNPDANVDSGDCIISGCVDPEAVNYNPNATIDNGDCKYPKDRFVGTWSGTLTCTNPIIGGFLGDGFNDIRITEIEGEREKVLIAIGNDQNAEPVEGIINGDKLTFEASLDIPSIPGIPGEIVATAEGDYDINDEDTEMTGLVYINASTAVGPIVTEIVSDTCTSVITRN